MRHRRAFKRNSLTAAALAVFCAAALAAVLAGEAPEKKPATDWPRWRGPNMNGISAETGWLAKWSAEGPKQLWKVNVGAGYSAVAVGKGRLYTMGNRKNTDTIWCLNAATGEELWKQSYPCRNVQHPGPRVSLPRGSRPHGASPQRSCRLPAEASLPATSTLFPRPPETKGQEPPSRETRGH